MSCGYHEAPALKGVNLITSTSKLLLKPNDYLQNVLWGYRNVSVPKQKLPLTAYVLREELKEFQRK